MRISCQFCAAEYEIEESRIPAEGLPVKCARCLGVFVVPAPLAAGWGTLGERDAQSAGGDLGGSVSDGWNDSAAWDVPAPSQNPPPSKSTMAWEGPPSSGLPEGWPSVATATTQAWESPPVAPVPAAGQPPAEAWGAPTSSTAAWGDSPSGWEHSPDAGWGAPGAPVAAPPVPDSVAPSWDDQPPHLDPELQRLLADHPGAGPFDDPDPTRLSADPWALPTASDAWSAPPRATTPLSQPTPDHLLPAVVATLPTMPRSAAPAHLGGGVVAGSSSGTSSAAGSGLDYFDLFGGESSSVGPRVDAVQYAIRRADGTVLGQYDQVTVRAHLQIGKLSRADQVSVDGGMSWQYLSAMSEFSDLTIVAPAPLPGGALARVENLPSRGRGGGEVVKSAAEVPQTSGGGGLESRGDGTPQVSGSWGPAIAGQAHIPAEGLYGGGIAAGSSESFRLVPAGSSGLAGTAVGGGLTSSAGGGGVLAAQGPAPTPSAKEPKDKGADRPSWLAPAVNTAEGRASMDARKSQRRRRLVLIVVLGLVFCGAAGFLLLWDPAFEGEGSIKKRITLDDVTIAKYRAQSRTLLQFGTYRAYAEARQKLLSVVRADPNDRVSRALYLQTMLYLVRDYGQSAVVKEVENVRKELAKTGDSGVEFRKAKISYALWKRDLTDALRNLELLLTADPDDREARFLQGLALSTPKDVAQAVKVFDGLIALDGKSAKYLRGKADALLLGDRDAGIGMLRQILTVAPNNPGAALRLAELYLESGRREDGRRLLSWLVEIRTPARREASPDELAKAQSLLGIIAFEDRDVESARRLLDAALTTATSDVERVRALVALGEVLIELRDFKGAIMRLELAQRSLPKSAEVLSHLSIAYSRDGQSKKARETVTSGRKALLDRKLEELPPAQKNEYYLQDARLRLASAVVNETDEIPRLGEAIDDYRAALELTQRVQGDAAGKLALDARIRLAGLLRRQKNLNGAQTELAEALKLNPKSPAVHNGLGELHADQGQTAKAEAAFRKALELEPRFTRARFNLAALLSEGGRLPEALELLKNIQKADPAFPGLNLAMAIAYQRQKMFREAIDAFERAIKASPDDPRVFLRIGVAYFEFGGEDSMKKAREYLDKAIEKNRQLNRAYYYRGRVLMEMGKPEIALDDYKTASEREPDNGLYRIYWGAAFEKMGSYRDAFFQYTRAIELLRDQRNEIDIAMALYRRGRLRLERDEVPAALQDLDEALKYDSANTEVLVLLGDSLAQARKHAQAVQRYRAALERGKKLKGLWFKLGKSLLEVNQRAEALKAMQNAAAEDPTDCYPHYFMGYLYKDSKQEVQAIRSLKRFLSICTAPPEKKDVDRDLYDMQARQGGAPK